MKIKKSLLSRLSLNGVPLDVLTKNIQVLYNTWKYWSILSYNHFGQIQYGNKF